MEYNNNALASLEASIDKFKKWNGINAINWGKYFHKDNLNISLDTKLTRAELLNSEFVKELSNEELAIAILSWGGMNREHGKSLFEHKEWTAVVANMRNGSIKSRKDAYELFQNLRKNGKLTGMGPAYFTKLICFVNPKLNGYIMDQWTSKSINIICNKNVIKLSKVGNVTDKNDSDNYETFCLIVEDLASKLNLNPLSMEEQLFSSGGFHKGTWRNYVVNIWNGENIKEILKVKAKIIIDSLEPISFEEVLRHLSENENCITTLGGKSSFRVKKVKDYIEIINSNNNSCKIDKTHWDKVMIRMDELPLDERGMTSRYGVGKHHFNWDGCPNQVFSLYIPAIVNYLSSKIDLK